MSEIPRPEYPRPQYVRNDWITLNGEWQFEIDKADTGLERGLVGRDLVTEILVPFAPESKHSGVNETDFLEAVWYRKHVMFPTAWRGRRIHLHFQAVEYDATVWVNGQEVGRHRGGSVPFSFDISDFLESTDLSGTIVVRARDSQRAIQPRGKQATEYAASGTNYDRTTGIWQSVWAEATGIAWIERFRITPDVNSGRFDLEIPLRNARKGMVAVASLMIGDRIIVRQEVPIAVDFTVRPQLLIPPEDIRLWSPEDPFLYDLRVELRDVESQVLDVVSSYAGLRSIAIDGKRVLLNGKPVFQRLVLDQGYWPETLMTAPSDEALIKDIKLAMSAGFNGARLHQKVFEERFLYHADRLGYLVWGEFGDWGAYRKGEEGYEQHQTTAWVSEWLEAVRRDCSHPSIVGWCPLNETLQLLHDRITSLDDVTSAMFLATKLADPTRPVIDASGHSHRIPHTDIWDSHSYEQDPAAFAALMSGLARDRPYTYTMPDGRPCSTPYAGQPYFVSEFGGIWWDAASEKFALGDDQLVSWGYGQRVHSEDEFYERFAGLVSTLLDNENMFGYCYTQLTDVFQEQNGIFTFDRVDKFDTARLNLIQSRRAACEEPSP